MPLIDRLPANQTIREFRAAATMRYWEATRLVTAGDRLAGIYLCGYTAEMLLKAAYFRLTGKGPNDAIALADVQNAKKYAITTLGLPWPGNLHDLTRWGELLIEDRIHRHVPYPSAFTHGLNGRVQRIYVNWREQLRYRANRPYQGEVNSTIQSAFWLLGQYRFLQEQPMPRIMITSSSKSPKHDKLVKRLTQELNSPGNDLQPLILEEAIDSTGSRHVHVIWDQWKGIPDEERSRVIVEAYQQAEGATAAVQITIAAGVTAEESLALGLLPWRVVSARKRQEAQPTMAAYKKVFAAEARNTFIGAEAKDLRYARAEDAEEVRHRLEKTLPGSKWIVEREVQYE